jgi:hypothetical protein
MSILFSIFESCVVIINGKCKLSFQTPYIYEHFDRYFDALSFDHHMTDSGTETLTTNSRIQLKLPDWGFATAVGDLA